MYVTTECICEK